MKESGMNNPNKTQDMNNSGSVTVVRKRSQNELLDNYMGAGIAGIIGGAAVSTPLTFYINQKYLDVDRAIREKFLARYPDSNAERMNISSHGGVDGFGGNGPHSTWYDMTRAELLSQEEHKVARWIHNLGGRGSVSCWTALGAGALSAALYYTATASSREARQEELSREEIAKAIAQIKLGQAQQETNDTNEQNDGKNTSPDETVISVGNTEKMTAETRENVIA
jgi:hypothetical protein